MTGWSLYRTETGVRLVARVPAVLRHGGATVRVRWAGICGTDLQILSGTRPDTARVLGHEAVGVVTESRAPHLAVGRRVIVNPVDAAAQDHIVGHSTPGLFTDTFTAEPELVSRGGLVPLRDGLPTWAGALAEPLATVIYGWQLANLVRPIRSAAVIGTGSIGALHALYGQHTSVPTYLISANPDRLDWAIKRGLVPPHLALLAAERPAQPVDAVFVCVPRAGFDTAIDLAAQLLDPGGVLDVYGNPSADSRHATLATSLAQVRRANICGTRPNFTPIVVGGVHASGVSHRGTSADHLQDAMLALATGPGRWRPVITHLVSPAGAAALLTQAAAGDRLVTIDGAQRGKILIDTTATGRTPLSTDEAGQW
ncbi:alcohol dehydrogenase catalytic domain-containing protein [Longispora urticae]